MIRADRRREERQDRDLIKQGFMISDIEQSQMFALIRQMEIRLRKARATGEVGAVIRFIHDNLNLSLQRNGPFPVACKNKCWFCCSTWVASSTAQTIYFVRTLTAPSLREFKKRLSVSLGHVDGQDFEHRASSNELCPALENNSCTNYENRPMVCQTANSADAEVCQRSYVELSNDNIPMVAAPRMLASVYNTAFRVACVRLGIDGGAYEFIASAARILDQPDIEHRWLQGEAVLNGIPEDPVEPGYWEEVSKFSTAVFG